MHPCFSLCVTVVREGELCAKDGEVLFCQPEQPRTGATTINTAFFFLFPAWHTLFFLFSLSLLVLGANTQSTLCIIRPFLMEAARVSLQLKALN